MLDEQHAVQVIDFMLHLSLLKRDLIKRKIKKLQKAGEWT